VGRLVWGLMAYNKKQKREITASTKRFFLKNGWIIKDHVAEEFEFSVGKSKLEYLLYCAEADMLRFMSITSLAERMERHTRNVRARLSRTIIYVLGSEIAGLPSSYFASRGLVVTTPEDLEFIARMTRYYDELPRDLEPRQVLLFEGSMQYCVLMSENFEKAGEMRPAIDWARRALRANHGFSNAYYKLFQLLNDSGRLEEAEELALEAVQIKRTELHFLRVLRRLAVQRADEASVAKWDGLIEQARSFL
jgi:tetratricopeptide (TPR) repeat protein